MFVLRPLYIVTGTVRVEGGVRGEAVSADRRAANVITTDYLRRLRPLRLLKTPFGCLVSPDQLDAVKHLTDDISRKISEYNTGKRRCHVMNGVLIEPLRGVRANAVAGWVEARRAKIAAGVLSALVA